MRLILFLHANQWESSSFLDSLTVEGCQRRNWHIGRDALLEEAPWQRLYTRGSNSDLITFTGFDQTTFHLLLELFSPMFDNCTPYIKNGPNGSGFRVLKPMEHRGRKRKIKAHSCLGLTLAWFRFHGMEYILQGWFGFTSTHLNIWLCFGRRILFKVLHDNDDERVRFPTDKEIGEQLEIIAA